MNIAGPLRTSLIALTIGLICPAAGAETLLLERSQREAAISKPARGSSMDAVLKRYGEPSSRMAPVGGDRPQHPPITRWVYPEFTVYFEHERVIDAVLNRSTPLEQGPKPAE
jgi:hypothetical protein